LEGVDERYVWARIHGVLTKALIDSGSTVNLMSPELARNAGLAFKKHDKPKRIIGYNGQPLSYQDGWITHQTEKIPVHIGRDITEASFDIQETRGTGIVLGMPWFISTNPQINWKTGEIRFDTKDSPELSGKDNSVDDHNNTEEVYEIVFDHVKDKSGNPVKATLPKEYMKYVTLFEEGDPEHALPEHQPWDHEIKIQEGKQVPPKKNAYKKRPEFLQMERDHVAKELKKGFIRKSKSSTASPGIFVPKAGGQWRYCIDYRALNAVTTKDVHPLPSIQLLQDALQGAKWFTKLDIPGAYNWIRIKHGDEWKTAFITHEGLYEYLVMPFGLTNAPATWQSYINDVLRKFLGKIVVVYLDDILIYSRTYEEHKIHVQEVLQTLLESQLRLAPHKCEFNKQRVEYLGYTLSQEGIEMSQDKVKSVLEWKPPNTVKEVQSFLGFCNFYRQFIQGYAQITTPLTALTRKEQAWVWKEEQKKAFQDLKQRFTEQPILLIFNPNEDVVIETDASDFALGACLSQKGLTGKLQPVAYWSRKFSPPELNYDVHDKELLAVVEALRKWWYYVEGTPKQVTVLTDHHNLTYFTSTKELNRRQMRWYLDIAELNFTIKYRKGSENERADALSRQEDYKKGVPKREKAQIFKELEEGTLVPNVPEPEQLSAFTTVTIDTIDVLAEQDCQEVQELLEDLGKGYTVKDGKLYYHQRLYVPTNVRQELIKKHHDPPTVGHPGRNKTLGLLLRHYNYPGMSGDVKEYVKNCTTCLKSKKERHKPYGHIQPTEVPERPWEVIAMDFITDLPESREPFTGASYNQIMVVTDRLTKYGYFIPYRANTNATELAYLFVRNIVARHGTPRKVITDRDRLFTSKFWKALMEQLGTQQGMSTAFHPQTDGQTERLNQTLEQYLRCYLNYQQDNWVELLPIAQLAYNSVESDSTGVSPNKANMGFDVPTLPDSENTRNLNMSAIDMGKEIKDLWEEMSASMWYVRDKMIAFHQDKRLGGPILKEGDKVFLSRKHIKTKRPNHKLDHTKLGPFEIKKKIGEVNYELKLPKHMRIHPIFHVALLEPAPPNAKLDDNPPEIAEEFEQPEYEIERILDTRKKGRQQQYLVKWAGYDVSESTWEPTSSFNNRQAITLFNQIQGQRQKVTCIQDQHRQMLNEQKQWKELTGHDTEYVLGNKDFRFWVKQKPVQENQEDQLTEAPRIRREVRQGHSTRLGRNEAQDLQPEAPSQGFPAPRARPPPPPTPRSHATRLRSRRQHARQ
jgi:hypothetical protein